MSLADRIEAFLFSQIGPGFQQRRYLLAVSGGLDSICLFQAFKTLLPSQVAVAHYNHGLRGEASLGDASFVRSLSEGARIPYFEATRPAGGSKDEASLRTDRHRFLENACTESGCDFIVTAHHLNDQFETVLMRLLRGTGMDGLQGIAPLRDRWLRPLLSVSRQELESFATSLNWKYRHDASNDDLSYFRNRVRSDLAPAFFALSESYGGAEAFLQKFGQLTQELRLAEQVLEAQNRSLSAHLAVYTPFWARIDLALYSTLPLFWRLRFLRTSLKQLGVETLDRRDLERLAMSIEKKIPACSFTGVRYMQSCGYAYLQTKLQSDFARLPRKIDLCGNELHVPEIEMRLKLPPGKWEVRFFEPGDRFRGKKLKDIFLTQRIPQPERRLLPLLVQPGGQDIEWIFPIHKADLEVLSSPFPFAAPVKNLSHISEA